MTLDLKFFAVVFSTIFLAEIGDKTQLATLLFATEKEAGLWIVFAASSLALACASGIAVLGGTLISQYVEPKLLSYVAGIAFIIVGAWTIWAA